MLTALAVALVFQTPNTLTSAEKRAGWQLLFDGKSTKGWHNFGKKGVGPGWTIVDGVLTSTDPEHAGDIVTDKKFEWFELKLDFNIGPGQNSGIMFRVADSGKAPWHSGPEVQIYDHKADGKTQITGYLYELYKSPVDAAKPAGDWNTMRIVVSRDECTTHVNGVKYYDYNLGSPDFWARVKKSKFSEFPGFAKTKKGSIGIQGDHGVVSFRNIKIRPLR